MAIKKHGRGRRWEDIKKEIKAHPVLATVYFVLRLVVVGMLILNVWEKDYESAFICGLALILFLVPALLERSLRIDIPSVMEIMILLFIFGAEILGELQNYYQQYPHWDTMLHTTNGFLCAAFGFSMVDILTRNKQEKFRLSPLYVTLVAFCFSMTVGVLWEFFEYGMDVLFLTDMQKDTVIGQFATVTGAETGVTLWQDITQVTINGQDLGVAGYLDIGLHDTMADLMVNFLGAVAFSLIGYGYLRRRGKGRCGRILRHFLPELTGENPPNDPTNE